MLDSLEKRTGYKYKFKFHPIRIWGDKDAELENGEFYQIETEEYDGGFMRWYFLHPDYIYKQSFIDKRFCIESFIDAYNFWKENVRNQNT